MDMIPLELWKLIMTFCHSKEQMQMKHTCKYLYDNLIQNNQYLVPLYRKSMELLSEEQITLDDITRYLIRQSGESILNTKNVIESIVKYKRTLQSNCEHVICYRNRFLRCSLCDIEHNCQRCQSSTVVELEKRYCKKCKINTDLYPCFKCEIPYFKCKC